MNTFEYLQPKNLEEGQKQSENNWNKSQFYAGGTDLLGLLKDDIEHPEKLINLKTISGLDSIEYKKGTDLKIGSMVKIKDIAEHKLELL